MLENEFTPRKVVLNVCIVLGSHRVELVDRVAVGIPVRHTTRLAGGRFRVGGHCGQLQKKLQELGVGRSDSLGAYAIWCWIKRFSKLCRTE